MNIDISSFLKLLHKKETPKDKGEDTSTQHWEVVCFVSIPFLVAVVIVASFLFRSANQNEAILVTGNMKKGNVINVETVKNVLTIYNERKENFEKELLSPPSFVDPSQ